jgi:hypothetical protein
MKKITLSLFILFASLISFSQQKAKKPTVMIVPSKNWCFKYGYEILSKKDDGTPERTPDYEKALRENSDLGNVITRINGLMQDRGFYLDKLSELLDNQKADAVENSALTSKGGGEIQQTGFERLMAASKADINIELGWEVTKSGFNRSVQISLEAVDAATGESVTSVNPLGSPSATADIPTLLSEATLSVIDNFNFKLQDYFQDLLANGRKGKIIMKRFPEWKDDFETEFTVNGATKELNEIIEDWFKKNTVNGTFLNTQSTENVMLFNKVRIPMFDAAGSAIDAKQFIRPLRDYLKGAPFNITIKLVPQGTGKALLVFGSK